MNTSRPNLGNERGIAMVVTLLVVLVIGALITGAAVVGSNHMLVTRYYERESVLENAAETGLELARAMINADNSLYPASGFDTLENGVQVTAPDGSGIPGVRRWTYVGPSGVTSGQYGVFGSIVTVVRDAGGGRVIRRQQINQESFAKYAYFTDVEPSNIRFGGGDAIWGPVHSNSPIRIWSSGATFHSSVRTAQDVQDGHYATFHQGYEESVPSIAMPNTAELDKLRIQAQAGNTHFTNDDTQGHGETTMRIEFVAVDMNLDGDVTDENEGFIKVYRNTTDPDHVTAEEDGWSGTGTDLQYSTSCGKVASDGQFYTMLEYRSGLDPDADGWADAAASSDRRCLLGGDDRLNYPTDTFVPNDAFGGAWLQWGGTPDTALVNRVGALYAQYLHPINRPLNPNFKGVIMVDGKVAISGTLRGRVTVAATNDIILADDYTYATDPGDPNRACADILGIFSGDDVVVADNALNTAVPTTSDTGGLRSFDETPDEFFEGIVLALDIFTVEDYDDGPSSTEACDATSWGRGCLRLTGGIIQRTRGAVGTGGGTGYLKRYSYDQCGAEAPPPYFPTTGHFVKNQYYYVNPVNFNITNYWSLITP
ncbi:MAG: hypothetical protein HKO53_05835 [Gemmatimonadetes bacterium]|nr:hypothetical protein [Gemmatimonadota bacterium]